MIILNSQKKAGSTVTGYWLMVIDAYISFPLKKDSDYLDIRERYLAEAWITDRKKMLNRIHASYSKSPYFSDVYPVIEKAILFEENNLFLFILNSLNLVKIICK
jgi:hypothetical protein